MLVWRKVVFEILRNLRFSFAVLQKRKRHDTALEVKIERTFTISSVLLTLLLTLPLAFLSFLPFSTHIFLLSRKRGVPRLRFVRSDFRQRNHRTWTLVSRKVIFRGNRITPSDIFSFFNVNFTLFSVLVSRTSHFNRYDEIVSQILNKKTLFPSGGIHACSFSKCVNANEIVTKVYRIQTK